MLLPIVASVIYLFILAYLSLKAYRGTKTTQDYMLGGRQIHPMVMALSYGATFISTSAIVGFGGNAGLFGMSLLWLTFLNIFVGVFIAFLFFGKRTRKMGHNLDAHTFPELLGTRFNSRFIQGFSALVVFLFMPFYAAAVLKGGVGYLATTFNIDFNVTLFFFVMIIALYVSMGGMKGVMYTDAFQGSIMFAGMLFLLIFVYTKLGGVTQAHTALTNLMQEPAVQEQTAKMSAAGFQGWTSMPKFQSPYWWTVVTSVVMGVGIGVLAQPQLVVRFMTVKSNRELNRAVVSGGIFILMMTGVAFVVGALANVVFFQTEGKVAMVAAGGVIDNIIPLFLKNNLPGWFNTVFMLTLMSAAMSTLSSQYHVVGTSIGRDLFEKSLKIKGDSIIVTRIGIVISILVSALFAYVGNQLKTDIGVIAQATSIFFGICAAAFLPVYVGALYFRKLSKKAAIASILTGSIVSFIWIFFIHAKNASTIGLSKLLFGKPYLLAETAYAKLALVDAVIIAVPLSVIVLIVVALLTKPDVDEKHLDKCFNGIK
ncbi:MAG: sodium:solute symporter family protein [Eubacteriales bacterium]|nr:sodium:solute symporter family protein [Eubacteriales bacterium]